VLRSLSSLLPTFWPVMMAQVLVGASSSIFIPAICAVSLGVVGVHHFGYRSGFLFLATVASLALAILYFYMPETRKSEAARENQ
jgi:predicted MFS family arabinose efflux permease